MPKKMTEKLPQNNNRRLLLQYAGFAFQLMVALALAVYAGIWLDKQLKPGFPLLVWVLPLVVIVALIVKAVKDTNKRR